MPAMTNLLVKDDATTPKEWTFEPISDNPNPLWRTNDSALPLDGQIRLSVVLEKLKNGSYRASAKTETPILETLGASGTALGYVAAPRVAHVVTFITTMFADKRSTVADRANGLKLHVGLIQGASSTSGTGVLTNAAVGDGWKSMNYAITKFFSNLIVPN